MIAGLDVEIVSIFSTDITKRMSINQISKTLDKAYPYINKKVNSLIREGILNKTEIGRSYLCSINLSNQKTVAMLSFWEAVKKKNLRMSGRVFEEIECLRKEFRIHTVAALQKELHIVLDHIHDRDAINKRAGALSKHRLFFYTPQTFSEELLSNKNLFLKRIVVYAPERYYEILNDLTPQLYKRYSEMFYAKR